MYTYIQADTLRHRFKLCQLRSKLVITHTYTQARTHICVYIRKQTQRRGEAEIGEGETVDD